MKPSHLVLFFLFVILAISANAQKLPNVQTTSLRAPADIKVDGKATEWKKFQAYNKATDVYYSLANDKDKLYLVIQATDEYIIKKMLWGQTIVTINATGKKDDIKSIAIGYPVMKRNDRPFINFKEKHEIIKGNARSITEADSFMNINNKRLEEKSKLIKVAGLKDIDSLISVYNADGIKAASAFNNKMVYTYELAVDLKLLGLDVNTPARFYYNIKLDQLSAQDIPGVKISYDNKGNITSFDISNIQSYSPSYSLATDFWGEYTLTK
ncbi:MAG: hypothetical protein ABI367_10260 [Mucilaginibacter sp.]